MAAAKKIVKFYPDPEIPDEIAEKLVPLQGTKDSAGVDLRASILRELAVRPGEQHVVGTGMFVTIPKGYAIFITPRSGLASRHGISITNSPGLIDCDYTDRELMVIFQNTGKEIFFIQPFERIAQATGVKLIDGYEGVEVGGKRKGGLGSTGKE